MPHSDGHRQRYAVPFCWSCGHALRPCRGHRTRAHVVRARVSFRASTPDAARSHTRSIMVHFRLCVWHFGVQGLGGPAGARLVSVHERACERLCGGMHTWSMRHAYMQGQTCDVRVRAFRNPGCAAGRLRTVGEARWLCLCAGKREPDLSPVGGLAFVPLP